MLHEVCHERLDFFSFLFVAATLADFIGDLLVGQCGRGISLGNLNQMEPESSFDRRADLLEWLVKGGFDDGGFQASAAKPAERSVGELFCGIVGERFDELRERNSIGEAGLGVADEVAFFKEFQWCSVRRKNGGEMGCLDGFWKLGNLWIRGKPGAAFGIGRFAMSGGPEPVFGFQISLETPTEFGVR